VQRGFVYFRPVQIGYVRVFGAYKTSVPEAWRQLDGWFRAREVDIGRVTRYGLAHDNPRVVEPEKLRYDACVEVPPDLAGEINDELRVTKLPGGAFARKRYVGPYEGIGDALSTLREHWSHASDVVLDTRRPLLTVYLNNPRVHAPKDLKADLCVPVVSTAKGRRGADALDAE
jgi:AraC family transcriptional regulator